MRDTARTNVRVVWMGGGGGQERGRETCCPDAAGVTHARAKHKKRPSDPLPGAFSQMTKRLFELIETIQQQQAER